MKTCSKCKEEKELTLFSKDKRAKDGKYSWCKQCCNEKSKRWYHKDPERHKNSANLRYGVFTRNARVRKIEYTITKPEWLKLVQKVCHYCGSNEGLRRTLDRLDNSKGYHLDNVVPACNACNVGRCDNFTPEEWQVMINALLEHRYGSVAE